MISITGKKWKEKIANKNSIERLQQDHNFSQIFSKLLITRNFDESEILSVKNSLEFSNIFLNNKDFNKAIDLVVHFIKKKEMIYILGDYDVDGSAATSLFVRFFESIKQPFNFYIPDREKDGYGASKKLFQKLILKNPKLIIMVDCGSASNEAIDFLNKNKIKSIVIDHHEINKPYPEADVIINPKKNNGYLKYEYFCATTLVYFFLDLLSKKIKNNINIQDYLIYVLLATVCDVMPLRKLNRFIGLIALKEFKIENSDVIKKLFFLNNKKNKVNISDLGYLIGPILNAGGRLGKSNYAAELLSSKDPKTIEKRSIELIELNNKRKEIETIILNEINFDEIKKKNANIVIYYNPNINEGLIGIIAARLKDKYNKPSIVITKSGNILKGSSRSVKNFNIGRAIKDLSDKNVLLTGGGHNMAAGFTLKKENLKTFEELIIKNFSDSGVILDNEFYFDGKISSAAINNDFYNDIKKLEPFGTGNPVPTFFFNDLKVIKSTIISEKHITCILKSKIGFTIRGLSFNAFDSDIGKYLLNYRNNFNVIGQINENFWNNKKSLQLTIRDLVL